MDLKSVAKIFFKDIRDFLHYVNANMLIFAEDYYINVSSKLLYLDEKYVEEYWDTDSNFDIYVPAYLEEIKTRNIDILDALAIDMAMDIAMALTGAVGPEGEEVDEFKFDHEFELPQLPPPPTAVSKRMMYPWPLYEKDNNPFSDN